MTSDQTMRIVILTYESYQSNMMTHRLLTEFPGQVVGVLRSETIMPGKTTLQSAWFLLNRTGLGFVIPKTLEIIIGRLAAVFLKLTGKQPPVPSLAQLSAEFGVPVVGAENVNSAQSLATLKAWQPDLVISVYLNQLIKAEIINLAPKGVINIHPALLPKNRGLFPYFWALSNGDAETGVTVHWVDTQFDTGAVLAQQSLPIQPDDTVISLAHQSAIIGAELLAQAVAMIQADNPPKITQNSNDASYFSWPRPDDVRRFKKRGRRYGSIFEMWKLVTQSLSPGSESGD